MHLRIFLLVHGATGTQITIKENEKLERHCKRFARGLRAGIRCFAGYQPEKDQVAFTDLKKDPDPMSSSHDIIESIKPEKKPVMQIKNY